MNELLAFECPEELMVDDDKGTLAKIQADLKKYQAYQSKQRAKDRDPNTLRGLVHQLKSATRDKAEAEQKIRQTEKRILRMALGEHFDPQFEWWLKITPVRDGLMIISTPGTIVSGSAVALVQPDGTVIKLWPPGSGQILGLQE